MVSAVAGVPAAAVVRLPAVIELMRYCHNYSPGALFFILLDSSQTRILLKISQKK
jgi:hypothetical protein